jgi:hypothetical protein
MSDKKIVTQHFDDPIGSIVRIDGECYVKTRNSSDLQTKYLADIGQTEDFDTCLRCIPQCVPTCMPIGSGSPYGAGNSTFWLEASSIEEAQSWILNLNTPHATDTNSDYDRKVDIVLYTGEVCQVYGTWDIMFAYTVSEIQVNINPALGGTRPYTFKGMDATSGIAREWYYNPSSQNQRKNWVRGGCVTIAEE